LYELHPFLAAPIGNQAGASFLPWLSSFLNFHFLGTSIFGPHSGLTYPLVAVSNISLDYPRGTSSAKKAILCQFFWPWRVQWKARNPLDSRPRSCLVATEATPRKLNLHTVFLFSDLLICPVGVGNMVKSTNTRSGGCAWCRRQKVKVTDYSRYLITSGN
jgi:hypothetical protein